MSTQQTQLADEITLDEKRAQERARVKNYKKQKENIKLQDRLDIWDYQEHINETLNATDSINHLAREIKLSTKYNIFENFTSEQPLIAESYAQAA